MKRAGAKPLPNPGTTAWKKEVIKALKHSGFAIKKSKDCKGLTGRSTRGREQDKYILEAQAFLNTVVPD